MKRKTRDFFSPFDLHMGKFISSFTPDQNPHVALATALISSQLRNGHVCVRLPDFAGRKPAADDEQSSGPEFPELTTWLESLKQAGCVGRPGDFQPLILDDAHRLYFQRYWQYEQDVARFILSRLAQNAAFGISSRIIRRKLTEHFPAGASQGIQWPGLTAAAALIQKFLVITGSPGTGKTTTVAKVMAFLLDVWRKPLRIALCAPTGKAAARLEESVRKTKKDLAGPADLIDRIPEDAMTIHRLLGSIRHSPYFRFNEKNRLPYDLIVVDEASMLDLPLAAKLMTALNPEAQLILLGDKDQLASVETGAVLGSICFSDPLNIYSRAFAQKLEDVSGEKVEVSDEVLGVSDCIIELKQNYRFSAQSGIGLLSQAVKRGEPGQALKLIDEGKFPDIRLSEVLRAGEITGLLKNRALDSYRDYFGAVHAPIIDPDDIFNRFDAFRILCALRSGMWGAQSLNVAVEKLLAESGLIDPANPDYEGRPVMIAQNDYRLQLFNGDVGIILKDQADQGKLKVFFRDSKKSVRKIAPERIPRHETVWAMTIHKSQGSEFDRIALVLSDSDAPLLTRELLYTGITRARAHVDIWSTPEVVTQTIEKRILRQSGLTDALQSPTGTVTK